MLKGLIPACVTPINSNEDIDTEAVKMHMDFLIDCGVDGLLYCGTTGEFNNLNTVKRKVLLEKAAANNRNRVPLISGIGATSTAQAIENAQLAEQHGFNFHLLMTPWFEKPSLAGIEEYIKEIINHTKLPILLYHHPYRTYFNWPVAHIAEMYNKYKERIIGIKDSSGDYNRLLELKRLVDDNFLIFFECPDKFQQSKKLGAVGCIDGLTNLMPLEAVNAMKGDIEFTKQYKKIRSLVETSENYIGFLKSGLKLLGINTGTCFHPNHNLNINESEKLKEALVSIGRINIKTQYQNLPEAIQIINDSEKLAVDINSTEIVLSKAPENNCAYRHHPSIISFNNQIYCAFSEGIRNEDSRNQAVQILKNTTGNQWAKHFQIKPSQNQSTYYSNGGFSIIENELYLFVTEYSNAKYAQGSRDPHICWESLSTSFYKLVNDSWVKTQHIIPNFYSNEAARQLPIGGFITLGMDEAHNAVAYLSNKETPFLFKKYILNNIQDGLQLSEPTWGILNDKVTIFFRDLGVNKYIWISEYDDKNNSFTKPTISNFPNGNSKLFAFQLDDQHLAIINNATTWASQSRCQLSIAIANKSEYFNKPIILKNNLEVFPKYKGMHKMPGFQYPNACVANNNVYVIYSVNKEDIAQLTIPLQNLLKYSNNRAVVAH